jgi:acyl-coenzyme A thioesterase PaaI-like protein
VPPSDRTLTVRWQDPGELAARARSAGGSSVATVEGEIRSAESKLLAHGTSTCLIR